MDTYVPHVMSASDARRFVTPGRLAVWAMEKQRDGKPEQAVRLMTAATALLKAEVR